MKVFTLFLISIFFFFSPFFSFSQIGNSDGRYNVVIEKAYSFLNLLKDSKKEEVKNSFKETGFQKKKEFKHFLSQKNLEWVKQVIDTFGLPDKRDISISEWRTSSKDNVGNSMSVNLTFYFKEKNKEFSQIDDHVCLNFIRTNDGEFMLDGLMFFRKSDYEQVKHIIDQIP